MIVRDAEEVEIDRLTKLWYDGWQDAHARILPAEIAQLRTEEHLRIRMQAALPTVRVVGDVGEPLGFSIVQADELHQLYVSAHARGSGVARALIADAEARLLESGVESAWLACAIGNERAARFYEKCGWHRSGNVVLPTAALHGALPLEVWRYEKRLRSIAEHGS